MTTAHIDGQVTATSDPYRALLAGSEASASHRDLPALVHELTGLLHEVVRFDYLTLFLHDAARSAPRAAPAPPERRFPRGASGLFPSSSRFAPSTTRYQSLPCEGTYRRQRRRHGLCFRCKPVRAGAAVTITAADNRRPCEGVSHPANHGPRQAGGPDVSARREAGRAVGAGAGGVLAEHPGRTARINRSGGPDGRDLHRPRGPGVPGSHAPPRGRVGCRRLLDESHRGRDHPGAPSRLRAPEGRTFRVTGEHKLTMT